MVEQGYKKAMETKNILFGLMMGIEPITPLLSPLSGYLRSVLPVTPYQFPRLRMRESKTPYSLRFARTGGFEPTISSSREVFYL